MIIGEIIKSKDKETYDKLMKISDNNKNKEEYKNKLKRSKKCER